MVRKESDWVSNISASGSIRHRRQHKEVTDDQRFVGRQEKSLPVLAELKSWLEKTHPQVTTQSALGKALGYLASNWGSIEKTDKIVR